MIVESILHKSYFTSAVMCIIQVLSHVHSFKSGKIVYILIGIYIMI